jgi:aromatic ring-opening dioxygenase catalytic subunit (LigB family)
LTAVWLNVKTVGETFSSIRREEKIVAKLVLAAGVPHPPRLVYEMAQSPGKLRGEALMKQVRQCVEEAEPDLIIEVDSDHFVNFFYNNLPSFCVGMAEEAQGPQEIWCPMPRYTVRGHVPMANALLRYAMNAKFDLAAAHELRLDHSLVVPLHFLNPSMELPVIPIYTNGFASPLPLATRCFSLGRMLGSFIAAWEGKERVALIASGCFAQDVGGPLRGWTDNEWMETISGLLVRGQYQALARRATEERINAAGNNSGELLNWITVTGAVGKTRPLFLENDEGSGYAVWKFE